MARSEIALAPSMHSKVHMLSPATKSAFDIKVKAFQSFYSTNPNLYSEGQFLLNREMAKSLQRDWEQALLYINNSNLYKGLLSSQALGLRQDLEGSTKFSSFPWYYTSSKDSFGSLTKRLEVIQKLAVTSGTYNPEQVLKTMVSGTFPSKGNGAGMAISSKNEPAWWSGDLLVPFSPSSPTLVRTAAVAYWSSDKCFLTANLVGSKYSKSLAKQRIIPNLISASDVALTVGGKSLVTYDKAKLTRYVTEIKKTIDAGYVVVVGVGSGVSFDTVARGEHYLLIFGYDSDAFIFWDSDAAVSRSVMWGSGFGVAYYRNDRFSTADSPADLDVDADGDHTQPGDFLSRHRYQLINFIQGR